MDGEGEIVYYQGSKYKGEWKYGNKHGHGALMSPDGSINYIGQWYYGKKHGHGTSVNSFGFKYVGQWRNDKMHGHGILTAPDGFVLYEGTWKFSKPSEGKIHIKEYLDESE
jgi:hypothetical protein